MSHFYTTRKDLLDSELCDYTLVSSLNENIRR